MTRKVCTFRSAWARGDGLTPRSGEKGSRHVPRCRAENFLARPTTAAFAAFKLASMRSTPWKRSWKSSAMMSCARTAEFRKQVAEGTSVDDLLVPAFATVREAGKRTLGQRHFDVQMIGGMVLHEGRIAEMKTGEGKTLVATLPVYLNALTGRGVHVVTVNDYLATRNSEWMGQIYSFLGLTTGVTCMVSMTSSAKGLRLRRHLRHQQRARLRLSARQHEVSAGRHGRTRPCLRHCRRSELDPHRRSAHATDHFRPARRSVGFLRHDRYVYPETGKGRPMRRRREAAHRDAHRSRHGEDGDGCCGTRAC